MNRKEISFNEFVKLCMEAEKLVQDLTAKHIKLQGKKPSTLKVAAIHILAERKGLHITFNQLRLIYRCDQPVFSRNKKLLKEAMDGKLGGCSFPIIPVESQLPSLSLSHPHKPKVESLMLETASFRS